MVILSFIRIVKFAFQDFFRNFWLSLITITILILSLFSINFLIIVGVVSQAAIASVESKIDLSLYLATDANEEDIGVLKNELTLLPEVTGVEYISKAQALEAFQFKHKDDSEIIESLRELGNNPLNPSLVVSARKLPDYEKVIASLDNLSKNNIIESRDFDDHKSLLTSMQNITYKAQQVAILISIIFGAITILVVFNAIRIAIYTHQKEIRIMKLVGASNWFIRAPFLAEAILYAFGGVLGIILIFYPFVHLLQPYLGAFFEAGNLQLVGYFQDNFIKIFGIQFLIAAIINIVASLLAVGKYLKV
ncbi:MAG: permease-like cell division protein FtsX [bacterium]|nr:permease-like cell division protein FtsX [bacterium]